MAQLTRSKIFHRSAAVVLTAIAFVSGWPVLAASLPAGDPARGEDAYLECSGCHTLQEHSIGPKHCGVFGRRAGTVPGFNFSEAMREPGIVWDVKKLNDFLIAPLSYVPNTNMGYAGLFEPQDRADLIAYLRKAAPDSGLCRHPASP